MSCLFVLWSITALILTLRRRDIFSSPKSVFVHQWYKLQTYIVKLKLTAIFLSLFGMFSEVMFHYCFRYFIYLQDLKVFYQPKGHICYCFRITILSLECKPQCFRLFFTQYYVPLE